jgi:integrase-like protein
VSSPAARHHSRNRTHLPEVRRDLDGRYLMPRPRTGSVFDKPWADGETVSFGAWVYAYGRREKVTFGTDKQGWNRPRGELETEKILQQIERGTWVPPRLEPREGRLEDAMAQLGVRGDQTFRAFAKRWWRSKRLRLGESTISDYEWRLGYLLAFFGRYRLSEITVQLIDRFRGRTARAGRDDPRGSRACGNEQGCARADRDRARQARPHLFATSAPALEHVDQRDDQTARTDSRTGG